MRFLSRRDVEALLDLDELVDAVADALVGLSAGRTSMPPRTAAMVEERSGLLAVMPAYLPTAGVVSCKLVSLFPGNAGTGIPTHQALIAVFDPATGTPIAMMDGEYITATRTAAVSALATRLLAREDAEVLAIVGTGVQARSHVRAVTRVRRFREVRVAGRTPGHVDALVSEEQDGLGVPPVAGAASVEAALDGADVVCVATHADSPVIDRAWLAPGAHVNSVGVNPGGPEVDVGTIRDAVVVVESRAAALAEPPTGATDLSRAVREGILEPDAVAELGEVVSGTAVGRLSRDELTLYKGVGVAVEDAAAASLALRRAGERREGTEIGL
jgi:ornithine cyclodeaminase